MPRAFVATVKKELSSLLVEAQLDVQDEIKIQLATA